MHDLFVPSWSKHCGNITNRALRAWLEVRWLEVQRRLDDGEVFVEVR